MYIIEPGISTADVVILSTIWLCNLGYHNYSLFNLIFFFLWYSNWRDVSALISFDLQQCSWIKRRFHTWYAYGVQKRFPAESDESARQHARTDWSGGRSALNICYQLTIYMCTCYNNDRSMRVHRSLDKSSKRLESVLLTNLGGNRVQGEIGTDGSRRCKKYVMRLHILIIMGPDVAYEIMRYLDAWLCNLSIEILWNLAHLNQRDERGRVETA